MVNEAIAKLADYAEHAGLIAAYERTWAINTILDVLKLDSYTEPEHTWDPAGIELAPVLEELLDDAHARGVLAENSVVYRDLFDTEIMGRLTPRPAQVIEMFQTLCARDPKAATDWYYTFSQDTNYIRRDRIARDMQWKAPTEYGDLDITINLSKPEKDPKAIAAARDLPASNYPRCQLCAENEGYAGRVNHPARQNHRVVPITINGSPWFLQYSPYVYYNEHCICFNFTFPGFEDVEAGIVKWPMSVIRISSEDPDRLIALADKILGKWRAYTDEAAVILAETDGVPHNTITPIARRRGEKFELDLVLRNNLTTEQYPLGLYHPHDELHHIKKENIGLIEVMGLAVLPARLKEELAAVADGLVHGRDLRADERTAKHAGWAEAFAPNYTITADNALEIVQKETGLVFAQVLEHAGVYKRTAEGKEAFLRFLNAI
ncbi:MAG: UDP-glucose--hexose-1-phosphate uridylyltransferase [Oscillibacter sp.]|nr:UDP-glucose--hexose-1-phosphate uridylyltransferase [Oscillibacter sp.]